MQESIIMEIRAGAGGEEAALFAADMFKMYSKYILNMGWRLEILDSGRTELSGLKQIVFEVRGENCMSKLKNEAGVHRVQRVPQTEKSNRVHTSTVSVAVLQKPKENDLTINHSEIKMDFFKASGPGGQYVNKRQTAVRLTHIPSGLVVASQAERSLEDNKRAALTILQARLIAQEKEKLQGAITQERRAQIGDADRAEKIRTYNFPQDRITDHRVNKSWHNIDKIMNGSLEKICDYLENQIAASG
ncbi:MAG: PCRF domain-containing protein [Patescibacteria group bacterium]|nr:PCRF domain-containing protein [Patescibacteria group bacterium]